ncbi:hypothetical protein HAL013_06430 [Helicobacter ailurogastricus]|uniref:Uncharacterized protein n=1 Tax=Helicobacter ailurogastricus TaxID=1578720 RepID=A0A0K2XC61_9HELI|nr:hypothetical protein HAL011_05190 [Helicobacter ailurogastricus]CRF42462.1 hypothetical protein HAL013_06430 [Helicobacter ailurogastricus]CRF43656.1 hypothetical protein HAL09_02030 [Helicobacter ailurogastricus]
MLGRVSCIFLHFLNSCARTPLVNFRALRDGLSLGFIPWVYPFGFRGFAMGLKSPANPPICIHLHLIL